MVRVHDTGIGMKAEFISRIFRPFMQRRENTGSQGSNTGRPGGIRTRAEHAFLCLIRVRMKR